MRMKKKILLIGLGVLIVFGIFLIASGKGDNKNTNLPTPTPSATITETSMEELKIEELVVGSGAEAVSGKKITVNYSGTLTDGTKFDSSYDRGVPFSFNLGAGEVIKGWDMGVLGMKVGGKRKLTIPASLGYGAEGAGGVIPP